MSVLNREGFAKGFVDQQYGAFAGRVPLLSSFYFGYGVGGPSVDNHLNSIMVLPGGSSQDLTPSADLTPTRVPDGRVQLMYRDKSPRSAKDEYFYQITHAFLAATVNRYQIRDVGCRGKCQREIQLPGSNSPGPVLGPSVLVLCGFKLFFTGNRDHHIDQIQVAIDDENKLTISFNDKNDDDVFGYLVDFARISGPGLNISKDEASGTARAGARVPLTRPSHAEFVLRGFNFDFRNKDHHIRDIGVVRKGSRMEVYFGDVNGDDTFDWNVSWAHVGPMVIAPT